MFFFKQGTWREKLVVLCQKYILLKVSKLAKPTIVHCKLAIITTCSIVYNKVGR